MGFRQAEWLLRERLRAGLQTLRDNPGLLDIMFADLSLNSRTHLKAWLLNHDISILLAYPRGLEDVPCWVISMSGNAPVRTPIGEGISYEDGEERGELVRKTYQVFTMSQNADLTLILSTMLQHILKSMRRTMDIDGFMQMSVAQEGPLDLRVDLLPNYLYARLTTVSMLVEDTFLFVDTALPSEMDFSFEIDLSLPPASEPC